MYPTERVYLYPIKKIFYLAFKKKSFKGVVWNTIESISSNFEQNLMKESFLVTNGLTLTHVAKCPKGLSCFEKQTAELFLK